MAELTLQQKAIMLKALESRVGELIRENKAELAKAMPPGRTDRVVIEDDVYGTVAMTLGAESIMVTDQDAYVSWCDQHHPDEVQVTTSVRSTFTSSLLVVGGQVVDKDGVVVAGAAARKGAPFLSVRPDKIMAPLMWDQLRTNITELVAGNE